MDWIEFSCSDSMVRTALSEGFNFRTNIHDGQKIVVDKTTKGEVVKFLASHQDHMGEVFDELITLRGKQARVWAWHIFIERNTGNERYVFNTLSTPKIEEAMEEALKKARAKEKALRLNDDD